MNTYITLACLLAVLGVSYSNPTPYGYGGAIIAPAAISSAHMYRAAPISVIRTAAVAPIIAPAVATVPVLRTVGVGHGSYGGLGYGSLGYGSLGYGSLGHGSLGYRNLGYGSRGLGGYGYGWGGYGGYGRGIHG